MADEQDALLREIDDELKQENLQKIWNKYGSLIVGASLALVVAVAGFKGWQHYDISNRMEAGERFAAAQTLAEAGKGDAAGDAFAALAKDSPAGYAMLARFQIAALAAKNGDTAGAASAYALIANDNAVPAVYRDLALVLGALVELDSQSGAGPLAARAEALAQGAGPWRFSAKEVAALTALKNGDVKTARQRYAELSKEAAAPQGLRARAAEMLNVLPES